MAQLKSTHISGDLNVQGNAVIAGATTISNDLTVNGGLDVENPTTFSDEVFMATDLEVANDTYLTNLSAGSIALSGTTNPTNGGVIITSGGCLYYSFDSSTSTLKFGTTKDKV